MQRDLVLKRLNFDLLTPSKGSGGGGGGGRGGGGVLWAKYLLPYDAFMILFNLICYMTMF